ncbi:MAG TPA: thiamine pyrophosphate-dependent dehydrogenase E1 component subunit alpha [Sphingomonadaceae bacterium]
MPSSNRPSAEEMLSFYRGIMLIRRAEERLSREIPKGEIPGGVHLYIGEEAVAVGACAALEERDWITSTHRGHGHYLAKGGDLALMYAEIWGKRTGICKGMGGSMHVADLSKGILGANGIVGAGFAIATGAAFGAKMRGEDRVAMCFFGDGAANQGSFMESMNVSSAWSLPTVFVCENNGFSEFTPSSTITGGKLADRAKAFMPASVVDGNDVLAVHEAISAAVERARAGDGPSYVECNTYRIRGHLEAEEFFLAGGKYREQIEIEHWQDAGRDPLMRFERYLLDNKFTDKAALETIERDILEQIDAAVAFAQEGEVADPALAPTLMFANS